MVVVVAYTRCVVRGVVPPPDTGVTNMTQRIILHIIAAALAGGWRFHLAGIRREFAFKRG